jgi:hypothetical protein
LARPHLNWIRLKFCFDPSPHTDLLRPAGEDAVQVTLTLISPFWEHCETFYRHPDGSPTGESENFHYALRAVRKLYTGTPATAFGPLALEAVMP